MKCLVLFFLALFLAGCAVVPTAGVPAYVVLVTPDVHTGHNRCTGVALDARRVLTTDHCLADPWMRRVLAQTGQEVRITSIARYPAQDAAIATLSAPLLLPAYARFAPADTKRPALLYGGCAHYLLAVPRAVHYVEESLTISLSPPYLRRAQHWRSHDRRICGGDSGGVAVQDGAVVGLTHMVELEVGRYVYGRDVHLIGSCELRMANCK